MSRAVVQWYQFFSNVWYELIMKPIMKKVSCHLCILLATIFHWQQTHVHAFKAAWLLWFSYHVKQQLDGTRYIGACIQCDTILCRLLSAVFSNDAAKATSGKSLKYKPVSSLLKIWWCEIFFPWWRRSQSYQQFLICWKFFTFNWRVSNPMPFAESPLPPFTCRKFIFSSM